MPFVVRGLSPMDVLGGGVIATMESAHASGDPLPHVSAIVAAVRTSDLDGLTAAEAVAKTNVRAEDARAILERLAEDGRVVPSSKIVGRIFVP